MLPPLNLLALDAGAMDADLKAWYGVQAPDAGFRATFSGMRQGTLPLDPALPEVFQHSTTVAPPLLSAGEGLPLPGKALPLEEPEVAPSLTANPEAARIPEIPDLPGAPVTDPREGTAALAPPPRSMHAQLSPAAGTRTPGEVLAGASAATESGNEQATVRTGQVTVLDHIRYVTPDTVARVLAEVAPTVTPAEVAALPLQHRNPPAIRDAAVLQQFVQQGTVAAKTGGQAGADALSRVHGEDARPAPSSATPPPLVSTVATAATAASSSPLQWVASQVHTSPGQPGWSDALGERVTWMTGNKLQNVELRLNPAELGPVRVQISVDDGNATVNFSAQHPLTREAIEQALPRLREMLADQGLSLQHANVSEGRREDQPAPGRHDDLVALASDSASSAPQADEGEVPAARHAVGLVDLFA